MKTKVYIASPLTIGDLSTNIRVQMKVFNQLMNYGYAPFAPLLMHFQNLYHTRPETEWLQYDFEWIEVCDYVLRLPGESRGADAEVEYALHLGIPVVYSIDELRNNLLTPLDK